MGTSQSDWQKSRPLVLVTTTALSALIGGATRQLVLEVDRPLCYPEPSFDEINRNRGVIQTRADLSATAIDELVERLFKNIRLVPEADVVKQYQTAAKAASPHPDANRNRRFDDRDEDDVVFLATAITTDGDVWSDDGVFKHQEHATWYRTSDVIRCSDVEL